MKCQFASTIPASFLRLMGSSFFNLPVGAFSMYPRSSVVESGQVLRTTPGPYRFRNYAARGRVVFQNKTPMSQYRAVGHPVAALMREAAVRAREEASVVAPWPDRFPMILIYDVYRWKRQHILET